LDVKPSHIQAFAEHLLKEHREVSYGRQTGTRTAINFLRMPKAVIQNSRPFFMAEPGKPRKTQKEEKCWDSIAIVTQRRRCQRMRFRPHLIVQPASKRLDKEKTCPWEKLYISPQPQTAREDFRATTSAPFAVPSSVQIPRTQGNCRRPLLPTFGSHILPTKRTLRP
jgi:hypothetical protein